MNNVVSNEVVDPTCFPLNISDERAMRASLAAALEASRAELERSLSDLQRAGSSGASSPQLEAIGAQLALIQQLQSTLNSGLSGAAFQDLQAKAYIAVISSAVLASDARTAASAAASTHTAEAALHLASEAARREVTSFVEDFYEKKIFDPFLRFASAEDEAAYREREARREREIKEALALGTPEGNLRAADLSIAQMEDAGAHGADRSPEFGPRLSGLKSARSDLATSMAEPMKEQEVQATPPPPGDVAAAGINLDPEMIASLRASGIVPANQEQQGHGVPRDAAATANRGRV